MYTFAFVFIATEIIKIPGFWSSYVADIAGPAWFYILLRGLYTNNPNRLCKIFHAPEIAVITVILICVTGEMAQYYGLYNRVYDPYDFIAYASLLLPLYMVDRLLVNRKMKSKQPY